MYINITSLILKSSCMETTHKAQKRLTYQNIANPHRWLKHFPNLSRTSRIGKSMSELSREMKKHDNPRKWRKTNGGWVGKKRCQFPSWLAFILSTEKLEKLNKEEYVVMWCIIIMDGKNVVKINLELEIKHSWDIDGMYWL